MIKILRVNSQVFRFIASLAAILRLNDQVFQFVVSAVSYTDIFDQDLGGKPFVNA